MIEKHPVTPEVLVWARKRAGYSPEGIVEKFNQKRILVNTIQDWEHGADRPTYTQIKKLAEWYKLPTVMFFLPKPPKEPSLSSQLRSLPDTRSKDIPPQMRYLIRCAMARQIEIAELHAGTVPGEFQQFKKSIQGITRTALEKPRLVANKMREIIGISVEEQKEWKDTDTALKTWRRILEECGIWIFKGAFKNDDYCGFFLQDDQFPVIYLNNSMSAVRQIFTLFHELGHLLLNKGGIDFREHIENHLSDSYRRDEIFCNAFAGAFLVPDSEIPK